MARGATVKVVEGWAKGIRRTLDEIDNTTLKVGVTERSGAAEHPKSTTGRTVGDIAFFNEYGTITTPARSFLRDWVDGNIDAIAKQLGGDTIKVITTGARMRDVLTKRGKVYREAMVRRILRSLPPPNAPSTLAQKTGDIPLIDTETLIDAIVYEVNKK